MQEQPWTGAGGSSSYLVTVAHEYHPLRHTKGNWALAELSMLKTIFLARGPHFKLLLGCSAATQHIRLPRDKGPLAYATNALQHASPAQHISKATPKQSVRNVLTQRGLSEVQALIRSYRKTRLKTVALQTIQSSFHLSPFFSTRQSLQYVTRRLLASKTPDYVLDFLRLASDLGFPMKPKDFETVCVFLSKAANWKLILAIVQAAIDQEGHGNTKLLNWRARALLQTRDYGRLQAILEDMSKSGAQPNQLTFHLMLTGALRNSDLARAQEIKEEMERNGCPANASTDGLVAQSYKSIGVDNDVEENALASLSEMSEVSQVGVLNGLIRGHMNNSDIRRALRLLSLFEPKSVEIVIEVLFGNGGAREMAYHTASYPDPLPKPPTPNTSTFSIFIHHCSHQRNLSGSLQLLQCMISQGIAPNQRIVTTLVQACFSCGRDDLAVQLVAGTCDTTPLFEFKPFHPGDWPSHCFEVHVPDMSPSAQVFNALIQGILPKHGVAGAERVIHIMGLNGVQPDERTLDLILCHLHFVERARPRTLLNLLHTLSGPHLRPTEKHMRIIVRSIQRQEEFLLHGRGWDSLKFTVANRELPENKASGVTQPFDSFAGLTLPMFRGYQELAEPFFEDLRDRDIKPDYATVALRIRHEAVIKMDMLAAANVFRTMLSRGMSPNVQHYANLMEGYALQGDIENTHRVLDSAKRAGIAPSIVLFTILITAYCRRGNPHLATRIFEDMVQSGIQPDVPSIDALASGFYALGSNATAKKLLISLWPYIEPFPDHLRDTPVLELARHFRTLHTRPRNAETKISHEKQLELHQKLVSLMNEWQQYTQKDGPRKSGSQPTTHIRPLLNKESLRDY